MDIGTAKADAAERARVPHHGLDLVDPDEPFTAADYRRAALDRARRHRRARRTRAARRAAPGSTCAPWHAASRSRPPGTIRASGRTSSDGSPDDGLPALVAELRDREPAAAERIDLANPRRVVRALERSLVTGSAIAPPPPRAIPPRPLARPAPRAERGRDRASRSAPGGSSRGGLLDEAAGLRARYAEDLPAFSAIGYREAFDVLAGRADLETAIATTVARTRAYAKRQRTWFRSQPDITWLDADEDPASTALAARGRVPPPERRTALCWGEMTRSRTIDLEPEVERAFLIAVETGDSDGWTAEDSLSELASLADTAGAEVVGAEWQNRRHVDPEWYLGKGRAAELATAKTQTGFTLLIADDELRPKQQRALESVVGTKVIDRSGLILDIFAQHARTHEGRLQVELAQLEYQLPRLTRLWTHLSRTQGGIGTRGPGETQLETDRRIIRERIKKLKERVGDVRRQRETAGRSRDRRHVPGVAIVGYTNAGKSSLLNALTGREDVIAEDRLFATLDPTSRQAKLGDGQSVVLTDTVGFIHKLPHQLVDAFRATLEEVNRADVLLEVVDGADPHAAGASPDGPGGPRRARRG